MFTEFEGQDVSKSDVLLHKLPYLTAVCYEQQRLKPRCVLFLVVLHSVTTSWLCWCTCLFWSLKLYAMRDCYFRELRVSTEHRERFPISTRLVLKNQKLYGRTRLVSRAYCRNELVFGTRHASTVQYVRRCLRYAFANLYAHRFWHPLSRRTNHIALVVSLKRWHVQSPSL